MAKQIQLANTFIGIEFGSTRIKVVLIDQYNRPLANGEFSWENKLVDQLWTYDLDLVWKGVQEAYQSMKAMLLQKYEVVLSHVGGIGFSAMMHGYLPFDDADNLLVPFRTWRNTNTSVAAEELTQLFQFNIPLRWSIAHLYQAIKNEEDHISHISFMTTLAGYVHWQLTGKKVLGIGDASGMFPVDPIELTYNERNMRQFNQLLDENEINVTIEELLPEILLAGEDAGILTEQGALLLDPSGELEAGIPICPPEGDAGTGMVATNSIMEQTGNVSAGTSVFSMIVLEKPLAHYYDEIDVVNTPDGKAVAMVHCNNFTSDINDWINLFYETFTLLGQKVDKDQLFTSLFEKALDADESIGDLVHCSYYSGEPITGLEEGRPLFVRMPDSKLNIANFMRSQINAALATLKIGMDILIDKERVSIENIYGHGGFFKTENVGQQLLADALDTPITLQSNAGEGGAWGMAILAAYRVNGKALTLEQFMSQHVFAEVNVKIKYPSEKGIQIFEAYLNKFKKVLDIERAAVNLLQ